LTSYPCHHDPVSFRLLRGYSLSSPDDISDATALFQNAGGAFVMLYVTRQVLPCQHPICGRM